jgi:hypothetical protein
VLHAAATGLFLVAAGCALKSPPNREALDKEALGQAMPPAQWSARGGVPGAVADDWLKNFNEPRLEALVDEALMRNVNLRIAATRVEQARASLKIAGGALTPAVNLLARGGANLGGDGSGLNGALLSASWEIDLWVACATARGPRPVSLPLSRPITLTRGSPWRRWWRRAGSWRRKAHSNGSLRATCLPQPSVSTNWRKSASG